MTNILLIGATSAISQSTSRLFAKDGATLFLIARDEARLKVISSDLLERGAKTVKTAVLDVREFECQEEVINRAFDELGTVDVMLIAHGTLPPQKQCEQDQSELLDAISVNGTASVSLLNLIAKKMEYQGHGTICVITSVAGDRGRATNYVYGASKKLVSTFLEGLGQRLNKCGVRILDIRPGFVKTPMTSEFDHSGLLWSKPETIAKSIHCAIRKSQGVVYTPWFWQYIMLTVRFLPRRIFNKLNF